MCTRKILSASAFACEALSVNRFEGFECVFECEFSCMSVCVCVCVVMSSFCTPQGMAHLLEMFVMRVKRLSPQHFAIRRLRLRPRSRNRQRHLTFVRDEWLVFNRTLHPLGLCISSVKEWEPHCPGLLFIPRYCLSMIHEYYAKEVLS